MDAPGSANTAFHDNHPNDAEDMHWMVCKILGIKGVNVDVVNLPKAKAIFATTMEVGRGVRYVSRYPLLLKACGAIIAGPVLND